MNVAAFTEIWFILLPILNTIRTSVSVNQDYEYDFKKSTENFISAIPTERLQTLASTTPQQNIDIHESTIMANGRPYRKANSDQVNSFVEPIPPVETSTTYKADLNSKYDYFETTEVLDRNKIVLPLTPETHGSIESPELKITKNNVESFTSPNGYVKQGEFTTGSETTLRTVSTEKHTPFDLAELNESNATIVSNNLRKSYNVYDNIETSSKSNAHSKTDKQFERWLTPAEIDKMIVNSTQMTVIGIPKQTHSEDQVSKLDNLTERVMILQPSKEEKYVWLKEIVHNMADNAMLKRETEDFVIQFNRRYKDLPLIEADNTSWRKYSRAIVETFVLDFCNNYPQYTESQQSIAGWYKAEEYNSIYNMTVHNLIRKRKHTALQFAAPVRRAADIYKAILDTPLGIVQSKCNSKMPRWLCVAEYLVHLEEESEACEYVWYHAQVHLTALQSIRNAKGVKDTADEVIKQLDRKLSGLKQNDDVNYLFDFIVTTLDNLETTLKDSLLSTASLYNLIKNLQSEDKLRCLNIDDEGL